MASGGSFSTANAPGACVLSRVRGTRPDLGEPRPDLSYGKATVTLDDDAPVTVDLYSGTELYRQEVYDTGVLDEGAHTLTIRWTGTKNAAATGDQHLHGRPQDHGHADPGPSADALPGGGRAALSYAGLWSPAASGYASGGSFDYAVSAGATVNVAFQGTYMAWIAKTGPQYGKAARLAGRRRPPSRSTCTAPPPATRSASTTPASSPTPTTPSASLGPAPRTLPSTGTWSDVDAVDVMGTLTPAPLPTPVTVTYQQSDPRLDLPGHLVACYLGLCLGWQLLLRRLGGAAR